MLGGGGGANGMCITHERLHVYMYMVYMYFRRKIWSSPSTCDATMVAQNTNILDNAFEGRD